MPRFPGWSAPSVPLQELSEFFRFFPGISFPEALPPVPCRPELPALPRFPVSPPLRRRDREAQPPGFFVRDFPLGGGLDGHEAALGAEI